jgi:hypothetical protein
LEEDNLNVIMDRQLYNNQFFKLIELMLKEVVSNCYSGGQKFPISYGSNVLNMKLTAFKIGQKVILDFLSHYKDEKNTL